MARAVGFGLCGVGCLLTVIGVILLAIQWKHTADELKQITWAIEDKNSFTIECKKGEDEEIFQLYKEKDGSCQEQFLKTNVNFNPEGTQESKKIDLDDLCSDKTAAPSSSADFASVGAVQFMARRLGDVHLTDVQIMAQFQFVRDEDNVTACELGTYSVESDKPLWAVSLSETKLQAGIWEVLRTLFWFCLLIVAGVIFKCVGSCVLCCN